jgi:hypothetical protein
VAFPNTTGLVSNHWGIYIDDQTVGGTNNPNPWAIYSVAGRNFFGGPIQLATGNVLNWNADSGISRLGAGSLAIGNGTAGDVTGALSLTTLNVLNSGSSTPAIVVTASGTPNNGPTLQVTGSDQEGLGVVLGVMNTNTSGYEIAIFDMSVDNTTTKGGSFFGSNNSITEYGLVIGMSMRAKALTPDVCLSTGTFDAGSGTGIHLFMQDSTGRIGIGTFSSPNFSPAATLDVTGNIRNSGGLQFGSDSGISRLSAGVIGIGTGAATSTAGSLVATNLQTTKLLGNTTTSDMQGIVTGATTTAAKSYAAAYATAPVVIVCPITSVSTFYVSTTSTAGFTVTYGPSESASFNYMVVGNPT